MGLCCAKIDKNKNKEQKGKLIIINTDLNSSNQIDKRDINKRIKVLQRGIDPEIEHLVNTYEHDINAYIFGKNKTLLLQAVISCPNEKIIKLIMEKGGNIDLPELQTGNPAIFLSAIDLKVNFVRELLKYKPNLNIRNKLNQNIFECLEFELIEQRKNFNREMTMKEKEDYDDIVRLLRKEEFGNIENLDDEFYN